MEKKWVFLGVDVSKKKVDICSIQLKIVKEISNNQKAFTELFNELDRNLESDQQLWVVFEHTGMYSSQLADFCSGKKVRFSQVPAMEIKRSMGLARGKDDRMDARRICKYAMEKSQSLVASPKTDPKLDRLKRLLGLRDKLVSQCAGFKTTVNELKEVLGLKSSDLEVKIQENLIETLNTRITNIEKEMDKIIEEESALKQSKELLTSVKGVGPIIALYTIIYTKNFSAFTNSRQFACYCGIAPFPNSSGSSIRGKTKVSSLANKKIKSLLEMGARSAIQYDPEIKDYYEKRVESGKNKTSTLNIVRNKLVGRMFAVIHKQQPYEIKNAN